MTGKPHDEVQQYFVIGMPPPGGESTEAMHARVAAGLEWLKTLDADKILLVSHGGPGRMIRAIIRDEKHTSIDSLASVGNAEVLELSI
jgi:broad specificity phosphatase PhoE